jgi:glycosyltransferase involved in cell wall biosynthesis
VRLLTYTTLYPNAVRPHNGVFVETRLRHLLASGEAQSRVIAPVPWFPLKHERFGQYGQLARVPRSEERFDISVRHPRYPLLPRVGMTSAPLSLATFSRGEVARLRHEGYDFELIDAHYFYPDGVAAALLARWFGRPFVITARGTDVNLIPRYRLPRRMIQWAAREAAAVITVCQALKDALIGLGVPGDKITVLRNGVDLERFAPVDRTQARAQLGLARPTLLSVGYLIERKGHHFAIEALKDLPEHELLIVGEGEERARLETLARALGVSDRVRFLGVIPQDQLRFCYGAADALVLASSREGWANVLLEAMACGTPVVATRLWGTPEVVTAPEAGVLMDERSSTALARAVRQLFADYPDRAATRRYAERFDWGTTTRGQLRLFREVLALWPTPAVS